MRFVALSASISDPHIHFPELAICEIRAADYPVFG